MWGWKQNDVIVVESGLIWVVQGGSVWGCGLCLGSEAGERAATEDEREPCARQREEHMYKSGGENGAGEWNEQK